MLSVQSPVLHNGLADLSRSKSVQGLPLGQEAICAGILAEAVEAGRLPLERVEARLGAPTALLLHDVLRVRELPGRADLFDDASAGALRDLALSIYDVRTDSHCV